MYEEWRTEYRVLNNNDWPVNTTECLWELISAAHPFCAHVCSELCSELTGLPFFLLFFYQQTLEKYDLVLVS